MADAQRLGHIEDELEIVKQLLVSTARYAESANKRIDRLIERQDVTQRQLDNLAVTVDRLSERVDTFVAKADDFIQTTQARNAVFGEVITRLDATQASTNAAIERLERILVRLVTPG